MTAAASDPKGSNEATSATGVAWLALDILIFVAFLLPIWCPENSGVSWVAASGILAILIAIGQGPVRECGRVVRWFALPLAATFALHRAPSASLAMCLPVIGIATGVGMAWQIRRILRQCAPLTSPPPSFRFVWLAAVLFLGYAAYWASRDDASRLRSDWVEASQDPATPKPTEFERAETLRLGPTNVLEIPGTFAGCEVQVRAVTAWNAVLEVAFSDSPGFASTSFFLGTDPRVRTGFARRDDPDSAVESIGVSGYGRQPYQRLDITLRRVDGTLTAFVVDRFDTPEAQQKQEQNAIAWAEADTGRACEISLLAAKGVFDVERVAVRPLVNTVTTAARPFTWRHRSVLLPLALLLLVLSVAYACRAAGLRNVVEGYLFFPLAGAIGFPSNPAPESLLDLAWRVMILGVPIATLGALPWLFGSRRSFPHALSASLSAVVALAAFAYAPQLVDGRSPLRFGTLHDWRGRSYEPDLAFLRHAPVRARNHYFEDHTFHGEVATALRTPDAKRIIIVGDDSLLARPRDNPTALAAELDVYLSAYLRVGSNARVREIECLDATASGRSPSNLPGLSFCEHVLLARANPPEDATGKPWQGPDVEALAPDFLVFLVTAQESIDGSHELLEEQIGPRAFRNWFDELREECDVGRGDDAERLRQLVKPLLRLVALAAAAKETTGRACGLLFVLPARKADGVATPILHSFGAFQLLAPVLPESAGDGKPCIREDGALTTEGQRLLARTLALVLAPQLAARDGR